MNPLADAFQNLNRWRHLPNYQLERRADVFFSVYLKGVVERHVKTGLADIVVPELPLKRELLWPEKPSRRSVKVDYVLFAKDRSKVFFVELKTAMASRREVQDDYLKIARCRGFKKIVEGIRDIMLSTTEYEKYFHLAHALAGFGFLKLPPNLKEHIFPERRHGLGKLLEAIEVANIDPPIHLIYLQPVADEKEDCIGFEEYAQYLDQHEDALSRFFRDHLRRWKDDAGRVPPVEDGP